MSRHISSRTEKKIICYITVIYNSHSVSYFLRGYTKVWYCFYLVSFITHCISARINPKQLLLLYPAIAWHDLFFKHLLLILSSYRKKRLFLDLNMNFPRKRTCRLYCPTYLNQYSKIPCIYIQKLASENHWRKMSWTVLSKTFHSWYGMGIKNIDYQFRYARI